MPFKFCYFFFFRFSVGIGAFVIGYVLSQNDVLNKDTRINILQGWSASRFDLRQAGWFRFPHRRLSVPGWWCSVFAGLWNFCLSACAVLPGLLLVWVFCPGGRAAFRWAARAGMPRGAFGVVVRGVLWSMWGSYSAM